MSTTTTPSTTMLRPSKIYGENFDYDITIVMKTRKLTFIECKHKPPTNIEAMGISPIQMQKSTYYYCPICKDFRTIKDIN